MDRVQLHLHKVSEGRVIASSHSVKTDDGYDLTIHRLMRRKDVIKTQIDARDKDVKRSFDVAMSRKLASKTQWRIYDAEVGAKNSFGTFFFFFFCMFTSLFSSILIWIYNLLCAIHPVYINGWYTGSVSTRLPSDRELLNKIGKQEKLASSIDERDVFLPLSKKLPVLLQHGLLESSFNWVVQGEKSLPVLLLHCGYDVWLGNNRGNEFSLRSVLPSQGLSKDVEGPASEAHRADEHLYSPSGDCVGKVANTKYVLFVRIGVYIIRHCYLLFCRSIIYINYCLHQYGVIVAAPFVLFFFFQVVFKSFCALNSLFLVKFPHASVLFTYFSLAGSLFGPNYFMNWVSNGPNFGYVFYITVYFLAVLLLLKVLRIQSLYRNFRGTALEKWSFEDMAKKDIPAILSHIQSTRNSQIPVICIGHSQGAIQLLLAASLSKEGEFSMRNTYRPTADDNVSLEKKISTPVYFVKSAAMCANAVPTDAVADRKFSAIQFPDNDMKPLNITQEESRTSDLDPLNFFKFSSSVSDEGDIVLPHPLVKWQTCLGQYSRLSHKEAISNISANSGQWKKCSSLPSRVIFKPDGASSIAAHKSCISELYLIVPPLSVKNLQQGSHVLTFLFRCAVKFTCTSISLVKFFERYLPGFLLTILAEFVVKTKMKFFWGHIETSQQKMIFRSTPSGSTSQMNLMHWQEVFTAGKLRNYKPDDLGDKIFYSFPNVSCPVYAFFGDIDNLIHSLESALLLINNLRTLEAVEIWHNFSHVDFTWGSHRYLDFYPHLIELVNCNNAKSGSAAE